MRKPNTLTPPHTLALLPLLLLSCCHDPLGEAGSPCNTDGTCDSPNLECVNGAEWLAIPIRQPYCRVRRVRP